MDSSVELSSSSSSSLLTTPKKTQLHSFSSASTTPMVATPEPRQFRILKPGSDSGSNLPKLTCGVAESRSRSSFLPQKYEMLYEFFNAMVNSIRLLRLKRQPSTLTRLSRSIESLTKRRFTLHHLAQLKHIVPEIIVVKKIRVQDRETNCMKEELLVSLDVDHENMKGSGGFSELKENFKSRLSDYSLTHDEDDDVSEGDIPQLFYQPKQEPEPSACIAPAPIALSHTAPSFKRWFSSRALGAPVSAEPSSHLPETPIKVPAATGEKDGVSISTIESKATPVSLASTPAKIASTPAKFVSTPAKLVLTPERLMAATPTLLPPKRPLATPDHDCSSDSPKKSAKRRALNFQHNCNDIEDQSSQVCEEETNCQAQGCNLQEKSRQQLMAGVPKLFDMILHLFQSIRRSAITKEELIYKLITGHLGIVDRRDVEKQLELLQEFAPECISEVQSLSGDTLLRLNKASCPESIRTKLLEAE